MENFKLNYKALEVMVSVIIPYYNRIKYVEIAVKSVYAQTYTDWEIILIDDCSNEDNGSVLKYKEGPQGQLVRHIKNSVNRGPGYSRNCGIKEACGEYLVFLDSDDILTDAYLEKMTREMTSDLLFVYCNASWVNGTIYKNSDNSYTSVLPTLIQNGRPWHTVAILWNKLHVSFFDEDLRAWEDYLFEFTAALRNNRIKHLNEVLVFIGGVDEMSLSSYAGTPFGWKSNIRAIDLMLLQLECKSFWKNAKLMQLLLLKYIHFSIRLRQFENESILRFKSITLRVLPRNVYFLKVLGKCLKIAK